MLNKDRGTAPALGVIEKLAFPPIKTESLSNGIIVKQIIGCSQPVCNIIISVKGGTYVATEPFIASCTANLLSEGTLTYPGNQLSELLDFYGFRVSSMATLYDSRLTLRTLSKHIEAAISSLGDMILNPEFSQENFKVEIEQSREGLKIANEKINYLAQKEFLQLLFGRKHKYGRLNSIESLKRVKLKDIKSFHKEHYIPSNFTIYVSGDVPANILELLEKEFGHMSGKPSPNTEYAPIEPITQKYSYINKNDAKQSAIFMGKTLVPYNDTDFPALYFLNIVLGGYFGSRLMTKLREEMGVTYGINSYLVPRKENTELYISTEVKAEATEISKTAIEEVIKTLQSELMSQEEINNVRNYIIGNLANLFDSSFSVTNQLLTLEHANSTLENFNRIIETARTITPEIIRQTALKHFNAQEFVCAISGN